MILVVISKVFILILYNSFCLARRVWREYFPAVNGIIFIVDSADWERIEENKTELQELLKDELVSSLAFLIVCIILSDRFYSSAHFGKQD